MPPAGVGETEGMRVYLPATADDLAHPSLAPRWAHTVTQALRVALPDEDVEGLAESAMLAAADESVERIRTDGASVMRRVVVAADVDDTEIADAEIDDAEAAGDEERLPSAVLVRTAVPWSQVVSIHVDEGAAEADVRAAVAGDDDALERAAERDLLWYDVVELAQLRGELAE